MTATLDTTLDQAVRGRDLLKHGFIWGGLGAAAATVELATVERAAGAPASGKRVVYDVACLGNTLRVILAPEGNPAVGT